MKRIFIQKSQSPESRFTLFGDPLRSSSPIRRECYQREVRVNSGDLFIRRLSVWPTDRSTEEPPRTPESENVVLGHFIRVDDDGPTPVV